MQEQALQTPGQNRLNQPKPHSISAANTYRQCPRLYYNRYVLGWEDTGEASWLSFGSKVDRLLEVLDKSNLQRAIEAIPGEFSDPFDQIDMKMLLSLWQAQYGSEMLPPVDLHGQEGNQYAFYVPFHGNDVTGMLHMTVSGKIDKVTIIDGEIGVFEGKTTSQPIDGSSSYWKKLKMDPQIRCYVWGLSKELGQPVSWVWYQVIRRPSEAANPAFARTHVVKGVVVPYTLEEYEKRVMSILENPPKKALIARKKLRISDESKDLFITEHAQTYLEIQSKKERQRVLEEAGASPELAWPRNQFGCDMFGGCSFWECCIGETTIEASGKFKRRER
jgi:hypothetical protein